MDSRKKKKPKKTKHDSLKHLSEWLNEQKEKVLLIYAFNGVGKTRLSYEFDEATTFKQKQMNKNVNEATICYNAYIEDLFHWDNDLKEGINRRLKIYPNDFINWIFEEEGKEKDVINLFKYYTNSKLKFSINRPSNTGLENAKNSHLEIYEIFFSVKESNGNTAKNIKISRGEESCFIWCIFYVLIKEIIEILNTKSDECHTTRFSDLKYIFIDDPVSSLDENNLIQIAVDLADLIYLSPHTLKFIITTHNPLFYNVIYNELCAKMRSNKNVDINRRDDKITLAGYLLRKNEDETFETTSVRHDSDTSFSYHLFLMQTIDEAIQSNSIRRYHFTLLRNLCEKTANFLGCPRWSKLLPSDSFGESVDKQQRYYSRIINLSSHSKLSNEEISELKDSDKKIVRESLKHIKKKYFHTEEFNTME